MIRIPLPLIAVLLVLSGSALFSSCSSHQRLLDEGNYDMVIERSLSRMTGKSKRDADEVAALEAAFAKVMAEETLEITRLKLASDPDIWPSLYRIYNRIAARQEKIEPFLPLVDENGYEAQFKFMRVLPLLEEAREKSAGYYYSEGRKLLEEAKNSNDRMKARDAYGTFLRVRDFDADYLDIQLLLEEAKSEGTAHVLISLINDTPYALDPSFEDALLSIGTRDLNSTWTSFYTRNFGEFDFDYLVAVKFRNIDISPGVVKERSYQETREIEEGFEYVLDERGNVRKDSLGNDIKIPKKVTIKAEVMEVYQRKASKIEGYIEILDGYTKNTLDSEPLFAENVFENYAATFKGDERALSEETKKRVGNRPVNFPPDGEMVLVLADRFKPMLKQKIRNTNLFR